MDTVTLTVREFIANIRKNGLPQAFGTLFVTVDGASIEKDDGIVGYWPIEEEFPIEPLELNSVGSACAFGQGLINSGAFFESANSELQSRIYQATHIQNDSGRLPLDVIADNLEETFKDELDEKLTFEAFNWTPYLAEQE